MIIPKLNSQKQESELVWLTSDADAEHFDLVSEVVGHVDLVKPRVSGRDIDQ